MITSEAIQITRTILFIICFILFIYSYLKDDIVLRCAGSLCVEGLGVLLLEGIESTDPFSIYGMPLIALTELFQHHDLVDL